MIEVLCVDTLDPMATRLFEKDAPICNVMVSN